MDTAFNHEPLWRAEWFDAEGYLIETRLVDEHEADTLAWRWEQAGVGGAIASFRLVPLNENLGREAA